MKKLALIFLMILPLWAQRHVTAKDMSYPVLAAQAGVKGLVLLEVGLTAKGDVENVAAISGPPLLVEAAEQNVKTWGFAQGQAEKIQIAYVFALGSKVEKMIYDDKARTALVTGVRPPAQP